MGLQLNSDFSDIVSALSSARVRYLVVGGYAVAEHTEPRYTKDLDLWVEPSKQNAARVFKALRRFGAPLRNMSPADFTNQSLVYQMGVEPVRIDILMGLEAVEFADAWRERTRAKWGRLTVNIMSPRHLVANKTSVGRPQDLADVARLLPLLSRRKRK